MKKLLSIILLTGLLTSLTLYAAKSDTSCSEGQWSGFTIEQLTEHLGLAGGNVTFEFDSPVFLHTKVIQKSSKDEPVKTVLDQWTSKNSAKYDLFVKIEDGERLPKDDWEIVYKKIEVGYHRYDREVINEPGMTGERVHDTGGSWRMNARLNCNNGDYKQTRAWANLTTRIKIGEEVTLFGFSDSHAPDGAFYKLIVSFETSRSLTESQEEEQ